VPQDLQRSKGYCTAVGGWRERLLSRIIGVQVFAAKLNSIPSPRRLPAREKFRHLNPTKSTAGVRFPCMGNLIATISKSFIITPLSDCRHYLSPGERNSIAELNPAVHSSINDPRLGNALRRLSRRWSL
jgi:hypothetical protein